MKRICLKFILFVSVMFSTTYMHADDYTDDAAEVDYYVPGILANDAMQMVNFLLCFFQKTNGSTFIDKGAYAALVDEAKCETASGADAASEGAAASGGSSAGGGGGAAGAENAVEEVTYTPGIFQNVTSGNTATGKGWVDLSLDVGGPAEVPVKAYVSSVISADKSATNRFGTFTMRYDLRNKQAVSGVFPVANLQINAGYLKVDGSTIEYREDGLQYPPRIIKVDLADPNNQQGYLQSIARTETGGGSRTFAVKHKVTVNEGANRYCQKFDGAQEYTNSATGPVATGSELSQSAFQTIIDDTIGAGGYVSTDGGTSSTLTGEHCWDTRKSQAKRVIYQYGTYKNSDGSRASLTNPSMSLEANTVDNGGLSNSIWSHASYWGSHVNPSDRANVSDTTIFRNQRDANDNNAYNLRKDYYEILKKTRERLPLNQLGGVSFQWYAGNFKDGGTYQAKLASLGDGIPVAGACNAAQANCPEYSGNITVNDAGTAVTFTITHGMDWGNGTTPFALDTPISFTAANWAADMSSGGYGRRMHFWDPDSHQSYTIPFDAFGDVDSTTLSSQARTRIQTKISIEQLKTDIAAESGDNATGLMCIRECLDANNINTAIDAAFTAAAVPENPGALNVSPFKNIGPWWKQVVYQDESPANNSQNLPAEPDIAAGEYNLVGGIKVADAAIYTVVTVGSVEKLRDGAAGDTYLEYNNANKPKVDARQHGDALSNYQYYYKPAGYPNNYSNAFGWAFHMTTVINSDTNKTALLCDHDGTNARGYRPSIKAKSNNAVIHSGGTNAYYCDYKLWEGAVSTQYEINFKQMPDYRLYNATTSQYVNVSAPETVIFTVPASGVNYNFAPSNTQPLAGKKYKLKFEGYGELHNIPGRVVNTCTGQVLGRYVNGGWNQCYRYIHEFIIPDGSVLTNASGEDLKVRALRGDEYLKKLDSIPAGVSYTATAADLPAASNLQNLFSGANAIGDVPTTVLNNGEPSVIHGETVVAP